MLFRSTNDDTSLAIAATNATQAEGNTGTTAFTFTVTRIGDTSGTSSVNWSVTGSGTNSANAADFGGTFPSGTVNFVPGETSQIITINVSGDIIFEPNEEFTVTLSNSTNATITIATVTGSIQNDDINQSPTNITLSNNNISENQAIGTVVGNLTTTDLDFGDNFTYSLVAGTGDTDNNSFTITNNQILTKAVFDFEAKNIYGIRVRTTDQGGLTFEKNFTINVNDLPNLNLTTTDQTDNINVANGDNNSITSTFANLQQNDNINGGLGIDNLILTGGTATDKISINVNDTTNQLNIPGTTVVQFERFDFSGFAGSLSFTGTAGNDWVKGGAGNDNIRGGNGDDYLNGGVGADSLIGGLGNDTYVVDNVGDFITEGLNEGIDTVESSIT